MDKRGSDHDEQSLDRYEALITRIWDGERRPGRMFYFSDRQHGHCLRALYITLFETWLHLLVPMCSPAYAPL